MNEKKIDCIEYTDIDKIELRRIRRIQDSIRRLNAEQEGIFNFKIFRRRKLNLELKEFDREYFFARANNVATRLNILKIISKHKYSYQTFIWMIENQEVIRNNDFPEELEHLLKTSKELMTEMLERASEESE